MQQKYWSLFTLQPCLDSKFIYCRNEMPVSVDNFSFGVPSILFMVHAVVQFLQNSVIMCNFKLCSSRNVISFLVYNGCFAIYVFHVDSLVLIEHEIIN